jgi:outer membrane protein
MRKFLSVIVLAAGTLFAGNVNAQTKIGYVRIDDIVGLMPELGQDKVNMDTVGAQFVRDSILPRITYAQGELTKKMQDYQDTVKNSKAVRDIILKEIQGLQDELNGADSYVQQVLQGKQQEFLRPYYAKAKKAIEAVAKKKGYTHIMSTDSFLVAPEADDISYPVLAELGIKLPEQQPKAPATKPVAKPAGK